MPLPPVMLAKYLIALSIEASGTSIPALRAANKPINTAPLTEVSASRALGE